MPELVYLSLWLRDFSEQTMLGYWKQAMEEFPPSSQFPGVRGLAIYPLDWSSTPVLDQTLREEASIEQAAALASEFLHADYAYEAQICWDLWVPQSSEPAEGWKQDARLVSLVCLGTEFDPVGTGGTGHLQINFGPDSGFLPPEEWELSGEEWRRQMASPQLRENVEKLISYVHRLQKRLPVSKRLLWCESGENLAEKIMSFWDLKV